MKHRKARVLPLALLAAASSLALPARADQIIPGGNLGNALWSEDEQISITGDLTITGSVVVERGVTVLLGTGVGITVDSGGSLAATGDDAKPIHFTSPKLVPACGDWNRLAFNGGSSGSLDHVVIQYASGGLTFTGLSSVGVSNCAIEDICEVTAPGGGPVISPEARALSDFDASGCTDLGDFLFIADHWLSASPLGGDPIGLPDLLSLLDNWQAGSGC